MEPQPNLFHTLGEWWDRRQAERRARATVVSSQPAPRLSRWLPTRGNVLFTLLLVGMLVIAQSVGALPQSLIPNLQSPPSTGTIAYQGRLADADGNPLTDTVPMIFRLYAAAGGGAPLWEEQWTGSSSVQVSDGLFNVMLGSLTPIPASLIASNSSLFLGITVGTDDEMDPRVQLGSVPFAVQALTVPDGSVTTTKIRNGAVSPEKAPWLIVAPEQNTRVEYGIGYHNQMITFSQPFTEPPIVLATAVDINPDWRINASVHSITASSFVLQIEYADYTQREDTIAGEPAYWIAVGR